MNQNTALTEITVLPRVVVSLFGMSTRRSGRSGNGLVAGLVILGAATMAAVPYFATKKIVSS
jgi:Mg2+ and Co2+ transporter CorA